MFGLVCCMSGWVITVQTDRPCYDIGNTVCISGRLTYNDWPQQSVSVSIGVKSSSGTPYFFDTATTDSNGNYNSNFTLGINAELGTYVVSASAEGHTNRTTFQAASPIHIKENGDVDPANAPISRNGNTYTLTNNIATNATNGIIIERNDTILDGAGFTLNGTKLANSNGIYLAFVNNVTIENISIESFYDGVHQRLCPNCHITDTNLFSNSNGIYYQQASHSTIEGNNITKNSYAGILLDGSYDNNITMNRLANSIASNFGAISLRGSSYDNSIVDNNFANNTLYGVYIEASYCNSIFHNNFFNNTHQGFVTSDSSGNVWDDGYPWGGNYWCDYNGTDSCSGPYQNVTGSDAMGDTPYGIFNNNIDHYPLMQPWTGFLVQSSTSITFSVNPVAVGSPVACTAAVSGSNPTGTVAWITSSGTGHFSNSNCTLSSGNCSTTYTDASPGNVTITASYSGDLNNAQSNSSATLTVSPVTTFDQVGAGSDFAGTVITIDGVNYTVGELPVSFLWAEGSSHSFSYASPLSASTGKQYVWNSTTGLSSVQNGSLTVTGSSIVTGNYTTQYYLTVFSAYDTAGGMGWYDSGSYASISTGQYVDIVSGSSRYSFIGWTTDDMAEIADAASTSTTVLMDMPKTVTANYVTQYSITFDQSGVGSDCTDTVVTIDGKNYTASALPASFWWNADSTHTFAFQSPLNVISGTKQYNWTSTNGLSTLQSDMITVTDLGKVVGNYATLLHDIAVTSVVAPPSVLYQGYGCEIEVSVANTGNYSETFNITVYANATIIQIKEVTLSSGNSTTIILGWNTSGFAKGSYTISAVASTVSGETDITDNTLTDGQVIIAMIGDVNADGKVDVKDVYKVGKAYGSAESPEPSPPGHPWDSDCDINNDGKVNVKDYYIVCKHYGEVDP